MNSPRWKGFRPWQRHSLVLAVGGLAYVCLGVSYITTPAIPSRAAALVWALDLAPMPVWGGVWVLVGLSALLSTVWPPASKTWGYAVMSGLASAWGSIYLVGWALLGAPAATSVAGAVVWLLMAFMWWGIAGLANPDDLPLPVRCPEEIERITDRG